MPKGKKWEPKNKDEKIIYDSILKSTIIKECMDRIKECSKDKYYPWLRDFFVFINQKPDEYIINGETIFDRKELIEYNHKLETDIINFFNHLIKLKKPPAPKTYRQAKASISKLLKTQKIVLNDLFWDDLNKLLPKDETATNFDMLDKNNLEKIFSCLNNQGKSIFLIQLSSGCRLDEILELKMEDIDISHEFPRFRISTDNSKNGHLVNKRMSPEAKKFYKFYLNDRPKWLESKNNRSKGKGKTGIDGRAFPMSKQNAIDKWNNAVKKAGLFEKDSVTGLSRTGSHMLRKYFRKQCKLSGNNDFGRWMSNHGRNIDNTYIFDNFTPKEIDDEYSKVVENLLIFGKTDVTDTKVKKLANKVEELERKLTIKKEDLQITKGRYDNLNKRFENIEHILNRRIGDDLSPFGGIELSKEEKEYERKLEDQEIKKGCKKLQKELDEGKHKGYELTMAMGKPLLTKIGDKNEDPTKEFGELVKAIIEGDDKKTDNLMDAIKKKEIIELKELINSLK